MAEYLSKPTKLRTAADIKQMIRLTEDLTYFKKNNKVNPSSHYRCCKDMTGQTVPRGKAVFFYGKEEIKRHN